MFKEDELENALEAVLFVSTDVLKASELAKIFDKPEDEIKEALEGLQKAYEVKDSGIILKQIAGGWRLYSNPKFHEIIEKYIMSLDPRKLSNAALETLAIIAYSQPVTRAGVASVRGVNSDSSINNLVEKGLVCEAGCSDSPGNPILYKTTGKFLENFGLNSIKDLPKIEDFAPDQKTKDFINERLSATKTDQTSQLEAFEDQDQPEKSLDDEKLEAKELFESALTGAMGLTEKVDLDKLKLNTDDE